MAYTAADYDTAIAKAEADNNPEAATELRARKAALSAPEKKKSSTPTVADYDGAIAKATADDNPAAAAELRRRRAALSTPDLDTYGDDRVDAFFAKHGTKRDDGTVEVEKEPENFITQLVRGNQGHVNTFYNEFSLGTFDDIKAGISALDQLGTVEDINTGRDDRSFFTGEGGFGGEGSKIRDFWDNQQDFTEEASIRREKFAQENPGEALLLSLAGGAASIVGGVTTRLGAAGVAKGTQLAAKAGMGKKAAGVTGAALGTGAVAGAEGVIYGTATMDGRINETSDKLIHIATYTGLGMVFGGALGGSFKAVSNKIASTKALKAKKRGAEYDTFLNDVNVLRMASQEPDMTPIQMVDAIMEKGGINSGWDAKDVERAIMADLAPAGPPTKTELELMESYRAANEAVWSSAPPSETSMLTKGVDYLGGAINSRIRNSSPTMSNYILKSDNRKAISKQNYEINMEGFARLNKRRYKKTVRPAIKAAWLSNDVEGVAALIAKTGDQTLIDGFAAVRKNNMEIADALRKSGVDVPDGEYLPRRVKDAKKLRKRLSPTQNANVQAALQATATRKYGRNGKPSQLTEREVAEVYSDLGHGSTVKSGKQTETLTSARERTVSNELAIENSDLYYDPLDSAIGYMREGVDLVENRLMMFGGGNAQNTIDRTRHNTLRAQYRERPRKQSEADWIADHQEVRGVGGAKITLEEGVENMIRMARGDGLPTLQEDEMRRLLMVRFGKGEESGWKWIADAKNIGMMSVLATPKAAALQLTELGHSFAFNGVGVTAHAIARSLMPANANRMTVKNIGMMDTVTAEIHGDLTSTSKWLGKALQLSGFKFTDRLGKNIYLDAANLKAQKQLMSNKGRLNFERKWSTVDPDTGATNNGGVFTPDEIAKIKDDLDNGVVAGLREGESPELALLMFHELSGIQPLTLSQLPEGMLANPNLRFMYTLKSFALKQADIIRTKMVGEYLKGNAATGDRAKYHYKEAARNTVAYALYTGGAYTLGNEARQAFFSFGADPIELDPQTITDSFIQHAFASLAVVNKYSVKGVEDGRLGGVIGEALIPPMPFYEAMISLAIKGMTGELESDDFGADSDLSRSVPLGIGELIWHTYGSGQETKKQQYRQRQRDRRREAARG